MNQFGIDMGCGLLYGPCEKVMRGGFNFHLDLANTYIFQKRFNAQISGLELFFYMY